MPRSLTPPTTPRTGRPKATQWPAIPKVTTAYGLDAQRRYRELTTKEVHTPERDD